jgi:hypothetical protein
MPDDEIVTEQEETEEVDPNEAQDAFDEDEEKEEEKEKDEKKEPEENDEEKSGEGDEKEEEEEEEKPQTAKDLIDKRLESIEDEEEPEEEGEEEKPEKKDETKPDVKVFTKEEVKDRLALISNDELPGELTIGNDTIDLKAYAEAYPDEFATMKVVSAFMAEKAVEKALSSLEYAKPGETDEKIAQVSQSVLQLSFDSKVAQAVDKEGNLRHPDYYNIVYGAGKEDFHKWVGGQSKKVQKLATSLDPDDGLLLLDFYKEDTAKSKSKALKDKSAKDKEKYDALHEDKTRGRKTIKREPADKVPKTEEEAKAIAKAAFEEDD